ncbi:hypothetical protein Tco_1331306 [Tanacetum coccineum]
MDDRGAGSSLCIMLGFLPLGPSFLVAPSVWLAGVGLEVVRKGGSQVLTPDLVVMEKVGASGLGVSLFPITERIWCFKVVPQIVLVLDVFFNLVPPLLFDERVEAELRKLIEFHTVVQRYIIVKDLYQNPFLYPMMGDLFDQVLEIDPCAFDGFVGPLSESKDHIS